MAGRPPGSQNKDKPFATALRMELAAIGDNDPRSLRGLARKLLLDASAGMNTLAAIKEVADRLDGKPAQESSVTITRNVNELTDEQIAARLAELRGDGVAGDDGETSGDTSKLH